MQDRLQEIRDRVKKQTIFPCVVRPDCDIELSNGEVMRETISRDKVNGKDYEKYYQQRLNNAEFIANAPSYIDFLLEALQEAQKEIERLKISVEDREARESYSANCAMQLADKLQQSQDRERVLREAVSKTCNSLGDMCLLVATAGGAGKQVDLWSLANEIVKIAEVLEEVEALGQEGK